MARVPDEEIGRLKREISLERLVAAHGVKLSKRGHDLVGLCPFHDDREPSLVVSPEQNLWHCLGACQTGGSVIDWVMRTEGLSFRHAVESLRGGAPLASPPSSGPARPKQRTTVRKLETLVRRDADDDALLRRVVDYYHATLKESPEALEYLASRGLSHPEAVERFRLGFSNRTLGYRLPEKNRKEGEELRGRLQKLGVYRESGHEHLSGSVVIPILDESGRVLGMYGRKITAGLRAGTPVHLYLPGPHAGVWNVEAVASSAEIILCESLIDALTFWCAGYRNVTTSYGVEGFTDAHREAFAKHGTKVVRIAYDRDEAGDRAAEKLSAELAASGITTYRVLFPRGMDANEYAMKVGPAEKSLGLALRQAVWMSGGGASASAPARAAAPRAARAEVAGVVGASDVSAGRASNASVAAAGEKAAEEAKAAPPSPHAPSLAASPSASQAPTPPAAASSASAPAGEDVVFVFGDRRWRIRGMNKHASAGELKVNVLVSREGGGFFVDTAELYAARQRAAFVRQAAEELEVEERVVKRELGEVLLRLEALRDEKMKEALAPKEQGVTMTDAERDEALALLRAPDLLDRILADFERCGVVGERTNKLVGYLGAVSRKLEEPLAIVIQSASAAGKSSLMDAVLALMPEEERVQYSAMTGQSLFYMSEQDLKHKILAVVEEQGAERASYALKLLQSEGELTIASTGKDPSTGKLVTHTYRVEGPVMIFLTTTAIEVDEELLNRCLVLTVDEGREQTRAIHELQRRAQTLEGMLLREERQRIRRVHRNAQRLLEPMRVVNPYAPELRFMDHATRTRRDHMKYLTLIRAVTLLHQHQRQAKTVEHRGEAVRYLEVTREDIAIANRLAHEVLGRSLDELPPQTRRLLELVHALVNEQAARAGLDVRDVRFSRRDVRESTQWSPEQLRVHLGRLVDLEYLVVHRGHRGQSFVYELCYDGGGADGARFVMGLLEPVAASAGAGAGAAVGTTSTLGGAEGELPRSNRGQTGPKPGGYRPAEISAKRLDLSLVATPTRPNARRALIRSAAHEIASHPQIVTVDGEVVAAPAAEAV